MTTTVRRLIAVLLELSFSLDTLASVGRSVGSAFADIGKSPIPQGLQADPAGDTPSP